MDNFKRDSCSIKGFIINSIFLFVSTIVMKYFPLMEMIVLMGYDCILLLIILCKALKKSIKIDYLCNVWALVVIGIIGFKLQSDYYLVYGVSTTITLDK